MQLVFASTIDPVEFCRDYPDDATLDQLEHIMGGPPEEVDAGPMESVDFDAILMGVL